MKIIDSASLNLKLRRNYYFDFTFMIRLFAPIFILLFFIAACNSSKEKIVSQDAIQFKIGEFKVNHCFDTVLGKFLFLDEQIGGNVKLVRTEHGNFYKYTIVNDTEFVFSCGRESKEVFVRKYYCEKYTRIPDLVYENYDYLVFSTKTGSDTWTDDIVHFNPDTLIQTQALCFDTIHRRFVDMTEDYEKNEVFFYVHDLSFKSTDTLKSNYYKFRQDGVPSLSISNVHLSDFKLFYSIQLANDSLVTDSLNIE